MNYLRNSKYIFNFLVTIKSKVNMNRSNETRGFGINTTGSKHNHTSDTRIVKDQKFTILPSPIQSSSDKKEYRVIKLANGLTACLIADHTAVELDQSCEEISSTESDSDASDESGSMEDENDDSMETDLKHNESTPDRKMAAAALCIGVGSFSDPPEVPGMAHFLEHMVFMGSEKFPAENDFDSFIKKGGGSDNASTDTETTCFYFECLPKHLYKGLDKFAQFFIAPLMKKGGMTRERESIESEFQMALPSDSSRKEQLLCSFAKPDSPVNSFYWGNLITLRDNISDDKLYEGVHAFRRRHYSAHRMTFAIQAGLPIETLQEYVLDCFQNVTNNNQPPVDFSCFANGIFDTPEFTRIYYIKPTNDLCQVDLTWSLPSLHNKYKSKPHHYLSNLMGDEGKGSILSYLKNKVWAVGSSIGNGESGTEHNSIYALFTVTMVLTEEGLKHLYEVIEVVFSYINMLKRIGPQERIFNEMKCISDTAFRFAKEETAVDMVEELSESMQLYPPVDYITGSELYYEYDPEAIIMVTNYLQPSKMNVMVMSNNLPDGIKYNKVEKWFGTEYADIEIPKAWVSRWKNVSPYPQLNIPPPNPYLTTDFSVLSESDNHPDYPQKISSSALFELWHRQDQKFKLPIAYYNFYLISPMSVESALSSAKLDVFLNLLSISIAEDLYPATNASLSHGFRNLEKGFAITVYGYNEKLPLIVELISKKLLTIGKDVSKDMFTAVKDKVMKNYYNQLLKPSSVAKGVRLNLLVNNCFTYAEKYSALMNTTFEEVIQFSEEFIKTMYFKALVQGNVSEETARDTVNKFIENLQFTQLSEQKYPRFRVTQLPIGEKCCRIEGFNKNDSNSVITNYYQASPFSVRSSAIIEVIMQIIEEPLFDTLRTKEQLGYHVDCSLRDTFGILGYTITVNAQATKHTADYIDNRIEEFLKHTQKLLKAITEEELIHIKEDLIKTKLCADVHLREEVDRNWSEITSDDYMFDRLKQEIDAIKDLKMDDVSTWWSIHNKFGKRENFRKLSIQIVGHNTKDEVDPSKKLELSMDTASLRNVEIKFLGGGEADGMENEDKIDFIQDFNSFRQNLFLYPSMPMK